MNKLDTYQNYYDLVFSGQGNIKYGKDDDMYFIKERCENCIKINESVIFWNMFVLKKLKKSNYIKPVFIIKREEIANYMNIFDNKTYYRITLPNVTSNDMIITNKLEDFIKFVKETGDSFFLVEKYYPEILLYNYRKIKYRYIVVLIDNDVLLYPINLALISKYASKIKNEKHQKYSINTDEDFKFSFGKEFNIKTQNKVKNIIKDLKTVLLDIVKFKKKGQYSIFAVDFIYDVDQNIYLDNIQSINDINYDKNVGVTNKSKIDAYYGYLGKNIHNYLLNKKTIFTNLNIKIEQFKNRGINIKYIIIAFLILWVTFIQNKINIIMNHHMIVLFLMILIFSNL